VAVGRPRDSAWYEDDSGADPRPESDSTKPKAIARTLGKYVLHGTLLSIILTVLAIGWVFLAAFLMIIGSILGLILAIAILFVIIGLVNSWLTSFLWFRVKTGWKAYLADGLFLGIVLLIVEGAPDLLVQRLTDTLPVIQAIVLRVLVIAMYAPIDGVIGKRIAREWQVGPDF
jgi:hypothetical protein